MFFRNDHFRFAATGGLALLYSFLRATEYSTWVKPLPVALWLLIVILSPKRPEGKWVATSLGAALIGDILLDLGENWLVVATIPFLGSTLLLAFAFHRRSQMTLKYQSSYKDLLILIPIVFAAIFFFQFTSPSTAPSAVKIGGVLLTISTLLLWRALAVFIFGDNKSDPSFRRLAGVVGAIGIVSNYLLYAIDLSVRPVPRDLVIQVYYWGQAFAAWSFLLPESRVLRMR